MHRFDWRNLVLARKSWWSAVSELCPLFPIDRNLGQTCGLDDVRSSSDHKCNLVFELSGNVSLILKLISCNISERQQILTEKDSSVRAKPPCCLTCISVRALQLTSLNCIGLAGSGLSDAIYCGSRIRDGSVGDLFATRIKVCH